MYKHVVKYEDYNGKPQEKTLLFNLSKGELLKMELKAKNGLEAQLREVSESKDREKILETFEWIIDMAYGEKSSDGQSFYKSPDLLRDFKQSPAYDEFLFDLLTTEDAAAAFVRNIVPNTDSIKKAIPNVDN